MGTVGRSRSASGSTGLLWDSNRNAPFSQVNNEWMIYPNLFFEPGLDLNRRHETE